jgi:hypothetical protein
VLEDVLDDKVTPDHARQAYGVVLDGSKVKVDVEATAELRRSMQPRARP